MSADNGGPVGKAPVVIEESAKFRVGKRAVREGESGLENGQENGRKRRR